MWYSQAGQDEWVVKMLNGKTDGVFVDVGAYDGIESSNTYALENIGWTGICIEGNPDVYKTLIQKRKCACLNAAVTNYNGECSFGHDRIGGHRRVDAGTLDYLIQNNWFTRIDYLSMDIEGHELTVLSVFPFEKWPIRLITVEHNLYCDGPEKKDALFSLLTANGFTRVQEDVKCLDPNPAWFGKPYEDWYAKL